MKHSHTHAHADGTRHGHFHEHDGIVPPISSRDHKEHESSEHEHDHPASELPAEAWPGMDELLLHLDAGHGMFIGQAGLGKTPGRREHSGRPERKEPATGIAIYHVMRAREDFITTAGLLWVMVRQAGLMYPGKPRQLYLDIEGHGRKEHDAEAREIISFTRAALGPFVTRTPWGKTDENASQLETLPDVIITAGDDGDTRILTGDRDEPVAGAGYHRPGSPATTTAVIYVRTHGAFARDQEK
jgi:hypothetical protein